MESKVTLFDASGVQIGETYARRARQLVKQQRAIWADDTHTAIQFMPDQEEWEMAHAEAEMAHTPSSQAATATASSAATATSSFSAASSHSHMSGHKPGVLYMLAEQRIIDRKRMILHSLIFIPGYIAIAILWSLVVNGRWHEMAFLTAGFAWGSWTVAYFAHLRSFFKNKGNYMLSGGSEIRRRIKLEAEVERLKRMGFTD